MFNPGHAIIRRRMSRKWHTIETVNNKILIASYSVCTHGILNGVISRHLERQQDFQRHWVSLDYLRLSEPDTRNTFCQTQESVQCNFVIFDHVTFIQFKICCCVPNFMKIRWFSVRYCDISIFKNGGRTLSWNRFTTIRDHPRSLCCTLQLPVKFHVNRKHRSEDIAIWIFRIFGLKGPQNGVFEDFEPLNVIIHHWDP